MSWTEEIRAMLGEIRGVSGDRRTLRSFGLLMAIALGVVGLIVSWRGGESWIWLWSLGALFLAGALALPRALAPVHKVWMGLAIPLGWIMTRLILTLVYFVAITPIGLIGRLFGKSFLDQDIDRSRASYWESREDRTRGEESYRRQF